MVSADVCPDYNPGHMTTRDIALIHTSPAAIPPLMQFYSEAAPDLRITNLLDDGLLRLLAAQKYAVACERLAGMIETAIQTYGAELAMITCSSVTKSMAEQLDDSFAIPVLKIDYPMARQAIGYGKRVGLAATFPPTVAPTTRLLNDAAAEAGTEIEIVEQVVAEAYKALLAGDPENHDQLLLEGIKQLEQSNVSTIVLAQVSMARILPLAEDRISVPVLSSLHTSLNAIRDVLNTSSKE
jgi:aspartate/glutamate racemase